MKIFQAYAYHKAKLSDGVAQELGQVQLLESTLNLVQQDNPDGLFILESNQDTLGDNNIPGLSVFKELIVSFSATKRHGSIIYKSLL